MTEAVTSPVQLENQKQDILAFAADTTVLHSVLSLAASPDEWERAMSDPRAWLRERDVKIPETINIRFVNEVSAPRPLPQIEPRMPGPDWVPFEIQLTDCRKYWRPVKDDQGKIQKYEEVTLCFGFELRSNQPSPVG